MKIYQLCLALIISSSAFVFAAEKPAASKDGQGGQRESFKVDGRDAFVILPEKAASDTPWVWYAPTFPKLPGKEESWMIKRFLAKGIAVAGIDIGESYGNPEGRKIYSSFYQHLVGKRHFAKKPCLLARSRGGLMLYNWAVENPDKVAGIAGIYPVCNLRSYPGLEKAAPAYKLKADELDGMMIDHNPIERLKPLATAGVPILHLHGDNDKVVPFEHNTKILAKRYKQLGGPAEVELVKGQGHNLWKGWFQSEKLTEFIIARALGKPLEPLKKLKLLGIDINLEGRYVDVDAEVCLTDGTLELVACTRDTKEHESIFIIDTRPILIHAALLLINAKPGQPAGLIKTKNGKFFPVSAAGDEIKVSVISTQADGKTKEIPIRDVIRSTEEPENKFPTSTFLFA
ncbi:MAG: prolyl oligopeptidase family serine peptidase, partial [Verrucomicrobiae bacterium]|nr:prolyl oligopeptidase family serine peptidase [Verrucomicrobiae bacterium]NNJ86473.1 prolyl oligopeptidase family serine peptidase [Akkermansiaceae bacterium]